MNAATNNNAEAPFLSLYTHGFLRVAAATPRVSLTQPARNVERTIALAAEASNKQSALVLFPELGLTGYSNEDLFFQDALLHAAEAALEELVAASRTLTPIIVVGLPLRRHGRLFNCAVVIHGGQMYGVIPKTYLPVYREFYERRQFCAAEHAAFGSVTLCDVKVPFGVDLLFEVPACHGLVFHIEICEDLWVPIPPSTHAAMAGAILLANLSASNVTIGKADYRRLLCASQSGRCIAGYVYTGAGFGESTNDLAWDGHALVYENAELIAESERFSATDQLTMADIDIDRLLQERSRLTSFMDCARLEIQPDRSWRRVIVPFAPPSTNVPLQRAVRRYPYVPFDSKERSARCHEIFEIQVQGLMQRLAASGFDRIVIGVSGGLDSALALLVAADAFDRLGVSRSNIHGYLLPGLATGASTSARAWRLMQSIGITPSEIDIRPAAERMLADIGHPFSHGERVYDTIFENVQAGQRTSLLFRLANQHRAIVVGTSDLSELALGYTTYGVGDQMAHYSVNASVPKTLVQYLIQWAIDTERIGKDTSETLKLVLAAPPSPELVPQIDGQAQEAEREVGPYVLQDFNLYYFSRYGYSPSKIAFLAECAWSQQCASADEPPTLDRSAIKHWLEVFIRRFIASQFKRSALPNGPKVGSGGSLSPRGDWRAPSDSDPAIWLEDLRRNVP